jgi:F0F1-type ATP synthase membrane subunit b/b'
VVHLSPHKQKSLVDSFQKAAENDVEHIFNEEFREELRNRGRLHFEKILGENAMFLQQDLRLTTAQLNDYMKEEISKDLKEAFANYENAIGDAKQLAVESIEKTKQAIDEQRQAMSAQLSQEVEAEKANRIKRFEDNMADIVNHYVLMAIGNQIDLNDQLEYILGELDANKQAIAEDVRNGA